MTCRAENQYNSLKLLPGMDSPGADNADYNKYKMSYPENALD